jgi:transposase, IS30 family
MGISFSHLTEADRLRIESMLRAKHSRRAVARALEVDMSTISREVERADTLDLPHYHAHLGQRVQAARRKDAGRKRRKLGADTNSACWQHVIAGLHGGWSPQQIAGRSRLMQSRSDPSLPNDVSVSHETIYCAIYAQPLGALRTELLRLLRKSHAGRLPPARGSARFTGLQGMTPIALRLAEVAACIVPGHLEGDLIKGAGNQSAVGTIVERASRLSSTASTAAFDPCRPLCEEP